MMSRPAGWIVAAALGAAALGVAAQTPVPVAGQGPGYHDPRSPFAPLEERDGVLSWKLLASVQMRLEKNRSVPMYPAAVQALNERTVRVQGFMLPLDPGDKQRHFLISSVPTSCAFCVPAGPEGLIEVRSKTPVRYTLEPVLLEGKLAVLNNDPYGLFYRVSEAVSAP